MELTLESFTHLGRPGLRLAGRLNGNTALQLEQFLAGTEPAPDWWDLSALVFLSSAGLRVLIAHEKRRRRLGVASSTLVGTPAAVREVLELTGLTDFWQLLPALPAAPRDTAAVASPMARGTQVEVAAGAEWLPLPGTHGALVQWRDAAGEGASLSSLPLAFGRAGLGVSREVAARRPFRFLTLGSLLTLHHEDGETDALQVAQPAQRFLRLETAWLLEGEPAGRLRLTATLPWHHLPACLPPALQRGWLGFFAVLPNSDHGLDIVVAVASPPAAEGPRHTEGVRLTVAASGMDMLQGCVTVSAAIEALQDLISAGPSSELPAQLPAGSLLWIWAVAAPVPAASHALAIEGTGFDDATELLTRSLYADCRRVRLSRLSGGFSAATWLVDSEDAEGRRYLPTVLKVGPPTMMNRENAAHEAHVRPFILNNASVALGHATQGDAVGLRYNFVGVTGDTGDLKTLARRWQEGDHVAVVEAFGQLAAEILRPWYGQARRRATRLYADHSPLRLFPGLLDAAQALLPELYAARRLPCPALGRDLPNPWRFLEERWTRLAEHVIDCPMAITHGDLNLNNLLTDGRGNLYVIDFSETRERSVASDFARNEPVFLLERAALEREPDDARFLKDVARLYSAATPWHAVPEDLVTIPRESRGFLREMRRLAHVHLGDEAPLQAWLLPVLEWTLPITLFGNLPERQRRLATWVAALQLERLELVAQEATQDLA